ncbi:MAG: thiamine pyrophosphate-binding protein [Alphaproteobacteria bacterium]|nr:thiamine pyrophosphate-binding protein [Alphaproteobacteria bacterium]
MTTTEYSVKASAILDELGRLGVTDIVTVPDYVMMSVHHKVEDGYLKGVRNINCATEDEVFCVCMGLWIGGRVPVALMQNQGLFAGSNALRSAGLHVGLPLLILAGQWGRELANLGKDPGGSARREVRMTEPLLDAMEVPRYRLEHPRDIGVIGEAFRRAQKESKPVCVLVGAHTAYA